MQTVEIRLECLRLAHRADKSPQDVIETAKEYLRWVGGNVPQITDSNQPADIPKVGRKKFDPDKSDKSHKPEL